MSHISEYPGVVTADILERVSHLQLAVNQINNVMNALVEDVSAVIGSSVNAPSPTTAPEPEAPALSTPELIQKNAHFMVPGSLHVLEGRVIVVFPARPDSSDLEALAETEAMVENQIDYALSLGLIDETAHTAILNIQEGISPAEDVSKLWATLDNPQLKRVMRLYWDEPYGDASAFAIAVPGDNPDLVLDLILLYAISMYGNITVESSTAYLREMLGIDG